MKETQTAIAHVTPATAEELSKFDERWAWNRQRDGERYFAPMRSHHEKRGFWDVDDANLDGIDARGFDDALIHFQTGEERDEAGYDWRGFDEDGFDEDGFNEAGFNRQHFDREGYSELGFNIAGLRRDGYSEAGYDRNGFDRQGYNRDGRDQAGVDRNGLDRRGFRRDGTHPETGTRWNKRGLDRDEKDADGYRYGRWDDQGYDRDGYDLAGFDKDGVRRDGSKVDADGFDADGYNADGYGPEFSSDRDRLERFRDRRGFGLDGLDDNDRNRHGHFQGSRGESLWWVSVKSQPWYLPTNSKSEVSTGFPYTRGNVRPDDIHFDCTYGPRRGAGVVIHGRSYLSLHFRARELFVLGQRLADDRAQGIETPHMRSDVKTWIEELEALRGAAVQALPANIRSYDSRDRQMMALALRAGLGYTEPTRRELIELGYDKEVRHYAPTLKWRKRSTLGSAA